MRGHLVCQTPVTKSERRTALIWVARAGLLGQSLALPSRWEWPIGIPACSPSTDREFL